MDGDGPSSGRRKLRFAPKAPQSSRKPKLTVTKSEARDEDGEAAQAQYLLSRFNENLTRQKPKVEKKSSLQIAFGPGAPSSTLLRTYGAQKGESSGKTTDPRQRSPDDNDGQIIGSLPSTSKDDGTGVCSSDAIEALAPKTKREYSEPWDYHHTYYPITLPLRRPWSGDPELLDQAEFVEAARKEYDENTINPASDLGLLEEGEKGKMFFFQLPTNLPVLKQPASTKGKEKAENSVSLERFGDLKKGCPLEELPGGYMGKMLVYKSGAVKLKLGETLYDVSPGSDCVFAQDVAALNTKEKQCCVVGKLDKRVVVTPDISSVLDSVIDLS
ncbi:DNA-directed RNA polymerase III subunit rpc4-like [Durio zibethinus]|uniref:DNA-directed RNA polymerase III subunit rpc4-like n=1 Tax=Durio zibethinus TaxID=66656 RepID=A0A6P5YBU2_DURZI|nr:DNA-directed RNA polymerase III subunit rpc4-like [Durio zibethinus]